MIALQNTVDIDGAQRTVRGNLDVEKEPGTVIALRRSGRTSLGGGECLCDLGIARSLAIRKLLRNEYLIGHVVNKLMQQPALLSRGRSKGPLVFAPQRFDKLITSIALAGALLVFDNRAGQVIDRVIAVKVLDQILVAESTLVKVHFSDAGLAGPGLGKPLLERHAAVDHRGLAGS